MNLVGSISANENENCTAEGVALSTTGPVSFTWGTYYGQSINNVFNDVKIDAAGNIYAFGTTINQGFDVILAKFDNSGALLWERFLGGADTDNFNSNDTYDYGKLALDNAGNIYITGITESNDFPTLNAFQATKGGGVDAFLAKYDSDGTLLMSSYLGGSGDENTGGGGDIAVDANGNIFVTGSTKSNSFFDNSSATQPNFSGGSESDIFVAKISSDFSIVTGTYWGDEEIDVAQGITIDATGKVWVVGNSNDSGLSLSGTYPDAIGGLDGVLLAWNNELSLLTNGSFLGGIFDEEIADVVTDLSGNIYITGGTYSTSDFPTVNAFQPNYQGGQMAFVTKFAANGALLWSTFLGGSQNEMGSSIAIDANSNVYISGFTSSRDFPDLRTAQATYNDWTCSEDGFVFKFNADGSQDWASFYGGWREDSPAGIAVNSNDQVVIVGKTKSIDLPTTTGAYKEEASYAGINAFVATFEIACPSTPIIIHSKEDALYHDQFWCNNYFSPSRNHFKSDTCALQLIAPPGYTTYDWFLNGNSFNANGQIISVNNPGSSQIREYHAEISDGIDCASSSTSTSTILKWVRPMCGFGSSFNEDELPHKSNIIEGYDNEFFCVGDVVDYLLTTDGFCEASVQWQKNFEDIPGAIDFNYNVTETGCYRVAIKNEFTGCIVYSRSKRFILLDSVIVNDYYSYQTDSECERIDSLDGCSSVYMRVRVESCEQCGTTPGGLTYEWLRDGVPISAGSNGSLSTTVEGTYTCRVSSGTCEITSDPVVVSIQPTEPPVWIQPSTSSVCIANMDSILVGISHPSAGDSSTIRFDMPYPTTDVIGYDSMVYIQDPTKGCVDAFLTKLNGCASSTPNIEFHDSLIAEIQIQGPACLPVRLNVVGNYSCEIDSMIWMTGDSVLRKTAYRTSYNVQEEGDYYCIVKNACGIFTSDTVSIQGNLPTPDILPLEPVCLPANISLDFPNPDSSIIIHWYMNPTAAGCYTTAQYLIPNQDGLNLVAAQPGFYFAILEDTISGCKSLCSDKVEVQTSAAGSSLNPSNNIFFCDGDGTENVTFTVNQSSSTFDYQWYRNNVELIGETSPTFTTNQEGVYRVFLENACDNAFTPSVSIYNIPNPTLEIDEPDTIYLCGPDTIRLETISDQPVIFQWFFEDVEIEDAIDSFYLAPTPGKYQVRGINNNSKCEDWSKEVFLLNTTPLALDFTVTPNCQGTCSGEIQTTVTGGIPFSNGSYDYNWSNTEVSSSITGLCNGIFYVTIVDAVGCSLIDSVVVDEGFSIIPTIDSISCFSENDGGISIAILGGKAPFDYTWNTGDTISDLSLLSAGSYQLTITDSIGCEKEETFLLTQPDELTIAFSHIDASCFGTADGSIRATILGGTMPYNLSWNSTVILDSSMLVAGMYEVTLTDKNNCEIIDSVSIGKPSELMVAITVTNEISCSDASDGEITVIPNGGTAPYQYLWEDASIDAIRSSLAADTYYVTITDNNNCTLIDSLILTAPQRLELFIEDQKDIACYDGSDGFIHLTASGGTVPFQFFMDGVPSADGQFDNLTAGSYEVFVRDSNSCATMPIMIDLDQPDSIVLMVSATAVICPNTATGTATISAQGGTGNYQYTWSNGLDGTTSDTLSEGSYSVTVTDVNSCAKIISFDIESPMLLATDFSIEQVKCFGESQGAVIINATTGGTAPYSYYLEGENLSQDNEQLDSLFEGSYILRTVDAQNCEIIDTVIIEEPDLLTANLIVQDSLLCQSAGDGMLSVSAAGGVAPFSFLWENGGVDSTLGNLIVGDYSVTISDANDCKVIEQINLPDGPFLELTVLDSTDISCWGENDGSFTVEPQGGTAPFQFHFDQQIFADGIFTDLAQGNYSIYATDINNCISATRIVEIEMPEQLEVGVITTAVLCPNDNTGTAEIDVEGGVGEYQFEWSNNEDSAFVDDLEAGIYIVTVNDENNCIDSIVFEINQPAPISIDFEIEQVSCFEKSDGSVKILFENGGTAPYIHSLNNQSFPEIDLTIEGLLAGDYSVLTIDENGCENVEELTISEPPLFSFDLGEDQIVELGQNAEIPLNIQNGIGNINYTVSPVEYLDCFDSSIDQCSNPTAILPIEDIVYDVILIDENGCSTTDEVRLKVINPDNNIYLGNAFNLNSRTGNEMFYIQSNPSVENIVKFQIFNRWGAQVFIQTNFSPNDKAHGWNGIFNGREVETGVYIYVVDYQTIDGKIKQKMGDVTVLK